MEQSIIRFSISLLCITITNTCNCMKHNVENNIKQVKYKENFNKFAITLASKQFDTHIHDVDYEPNKFGAGFIKTEFDMFTHALTDLDNEKTEYDIRTSDFSSNKSFLFIQSKRKVSVLSDLRSKKVTRTFKNVIQFQFSPDESYIIVVDKSCNAELINLKTSKTIMKIKNFRWCTFIGKFLVLHTIYYEKFLHNMFGIYEKEKTELINMETKETIRELQNVSHCDSCDDNKILAIKHFDNTYTFLDLERKSIIKKLSRTSGTYEISDNKKLFFTQCQTSASVLLNFYRYPYDMLILNNVSKVSFLKNDTLMLIKFENNIAHLYDPLNDKTISVYEDIYSCAHTNKFLLLESSDKPYSSQNTSLLVDLESYETIKTFENVYYYRFSIDNKFLFLKLKDDTGTLVNLETKNETHFPDVQRFAFANNGKNLVITFHDDTGILLDLTIQKIVRKFKNIWGCNLRCDEKILFVKYLTDTSELIDLKHNKILITYEENHSGYSFMSQDENFLLDIFEVGKNKLIDIKQQKTITEFDDTEYTKLKENYILAYKNREIPEISFLKAYKMHKPITFKKNLKNKQEKEQYTDIIIKTIN